MKTIDVPVDDSVMAKLTLVSDDHVIVNIKANNPLIINRVPTYGAVNLYRWSNKEWASYPQWAAESYILRSPYLTETVYRADDGILVRVSNAGREKFHQVCADLVNFWALHTNWAQGALDQARREAVNRQIAALEHKIGELVDKTTKMRAETNAIQHDGARLFYYIDHNSNGFGHKRRALRLENGTVIDTVEQPDER